MNSLRAWPAESDARRPHGAQGGCGVYRIETEYAPAPPPKGNSTRGRAKRAGDESFGIIDNISFARI